MRRPFLLIVVLTVALFVVWGFGAFMAPYPGGGWWGMGPNMMSGPGAWGGYGPGTTLGYGSGPVPGWNTRWGDLNLSTDTAKTYMERWLTWQGNPRLQVGDVKEKDADTIVADIVTKDNSLVQRFLINRHNGYFRPSED